MKCLFIGFTISAPVGAAGALVIRRTLEKSSWLGFFVGLGAASSDVIFASLGLFGSIGVQDFLKTYETPILLGGGIVLLSMAIQAEIKRRFSKRALGPRVVSANQDIENLENIEMSSTDLDVEKIPAKQFVECFAQGFVLTIINPLALFGFLGLFMVFGVAASVPEGFLGISFVLFGVFLGALCWWILLARFSRWMRLRLKDTWTDRLIVATNALIFLSSALFFGRVIFF